MYKIIIVFVSMLLSSACRNEEVKTEAVEITKEGNAIIVNEKSHILDQIVTRKAQIQPFSTQFRTVGTVRPVSGKFAEISPPFAGRITKSHVKLGQNIKVASPVFELGSSEFYEATKAYFAAVSANELAQRRYSRQKELASKGVAAQRDLEEAQSEANISNQELEQAKATLHLFNIDATSLRMGQPLVIVSPISGMVVKSNIVIGSYAREDSEPLAVIADLSNVWVTALVKETYFDAIKPGDHVEVHTYSNPDNVKKGNIHYIGDMVDEESRSLEVIIECSNSDRELKLGMFCDVHFLSSPKDAIILPSTAIMQEQDSDYVLIEEAKGRFVKHRVESMSVSQEDVMITSGLSGGENVVIKGGIYLNI
jgi:cobalt-zinc-cadmium efflux system membrane fusion protein